MTLQPFTPTKPAETGLDLICPDCGRLYASDVDDGLEPGTACDGCRMDRDDEAEHQRRRELATILAALRFWQREGLAYLWGADGRSTQLEGSISTDDGRLVPLTRAEIDGLCDRLNQ